MSKATTGMLEQGTQTPSLLQTSSPLNMNRELTLGLEQRTGARQPQQAFRLLWVGAEVHLTHRQVLSEKPSVRGVE
jgi:hypothetical protein